MARVARSQDTVLGVVYLNGTARHCPVVFLQVARSVRCDSLSGGLSPVFVLPYPVALSAVVLYALCYQLQSPVEPYMVSRLAAGDDSRAYSRVQAWFSAVQTVGSFLVGYLLDRFGLRGAFVINFLAAALSYALLANATSLSLLYLSKLPTVAMHGFLCAQATVSQCTAGGRERVAALGRLTAAYTVGATLGPALGGYLGANVDHYIGAKLAVGGSLLSAWLAHAFVPTQLQAHADREQEKEAVDDFDGCGFRSKAVRVVALTYDTLSIKLVTGMANSMQATALPLVLKNVFAFREDMMGLTQAAMTFLTSLCNAFFLGPLAARLGSLTSVIRICLVGTFVGLSLQAAFLKHSDLTAEAFIMCRLLLNLFQFILASSLTGESTSRTPPHLRGTLLGTEHGLFSAVRVFSPTMAVSILEAHGVLGLTMAASGLYGVVTAVWMLGSAPSASRADTLAAGRAAAGLEPTPALNKAD